VNKNKSNTCRGIVVALKANFFIVEINVNNLNLPTTDLSLTSSRLLCTRRSKLDYKGLYIDVGDIVFLASIDWKNKRAVISDVEPRKSFLIRPAVANVSLIAICISVDEPLFDPEQTSRFLITAESTNINTLLVLTKIDMISKEKLNLYLQRLQLWGYEAIPISLDKNIGVDLLINKFQKTQLSVLAGPSGVGKTSLINYLLPSLSLPTANVSKKLKRGVHTTRHVELFSIGDGSLIADTPGFNRPDIVCEPSDFAYFFPELRMQLINSKCKFRNCLHRDEPGCVIDKNIERYSFYRENLEEMINSHLPYQVD